MSFNIISKNFVLQNSLSTYSPPMLHFLNLIFFHGIRAQTMTFASSSSTSTNSQPTTHNSQSHSPLLLLSNMSNLMLIQLDYTNDIPWKHQLVTILEAYSLIEHIDGTMLQPSQFVLDAQGNSTASVNPKFQAWKIKDKVFLSLINLTLTP